MKGSSLRAGAAAVSLAMLVSSLPVSAADSGKMQIISGSYSYTSVEGNNIQNTDNFVYRDDCFTHSSFEGCSHLLTLSAQTALASVTRYGEDTDYDHIDDPGRGGQNILKMLGDMGFSDPETNKYYTLEMQENSAGVAVGHKKITAGGKTYTLLAVFPRSASYKQEWDGNFNVGNGTSHYGFRAARDEVLRFLKYYMGEHNITGGLKVWISGHSRGGAISNMLGGFFAGGGISYFDGVSITPEDVYCYTYAAPGTVLSNVNKAEFFSVGGSRGGVYAGDTAGKAYTSTLKGKLAADSDVFSGIHNYRMPYDIITMLPLEKWDYTCLGKTESLDDGGRITVEDMLTQLKNVSSYAYNRFLKGGDYRNFTWYTLDIPTLSMIPDPEKHTYADAETFMKGRVLELGHYAETVKEYISSGEQDALRALAGISGMSHDLSDLEIPDNAYLLLKSGLLPFLAYADEMLRAEGRSDSEKESVTIVLGEIFEYLTGDPVDTASFTADKAVVMLSEFISENKDSETVAYLTDTLYQKLSSVPGYFLITPLFNSCVDPKNKYTDREKMTAFLIALSQGPEEGSSAAKSGKTAANIRQNLYTVLNLAAPDVYAYLDGGKAKLSDISGDILNTLLQVEDSNGKVVRTYDSLGEAADDKLAEMLDAAAEGVKESSKKYGEQFHRQLLDHIQRAKDNISILRRSLMCVAFNSGKTFSVKDSAVTLATFIGNAGIIPPSHYNETYAAWCKANAAANSSEHDRYDEGFGAVSYSWSDDLSECTARAAGKADPYVELVETVRTKVVSNKAATCENAGSIVFRAVFENSIFKAQIKEKVLPALGHKWDEGKVIEQPGHKKDGIMLYTCLNDPSHTYKEAIPGYILGDADSSGKVNGKDLAIIIRSINGWNVVCDKRASDMDGNGKVNMKDYALLQRYLNGWDIGYPKG